MGDSFDYTPKYQQLLSDLKNTVEGLLVTQVANVWSIYGGLNRLHNTVEKIFKHGCKGSREEHGYYIFIQGLEWLQPENSKSYFSIDCEYRSYIPTHLKNDKSSIWLYRSLENHSLSQKLSWLLSDQSHLKSCYQPYAFLCQQKYAEAILICLRAVERNQPSLMADINPCLFLMKAQEFQKVHRRCSSFPDSQLKKIYEENSFRRRKTIQNISDEIGVEKFEQKKVKIYGKLKPWNSMPELVKTTLNIEKNEVYNQPSTTPTTPVYNKKVKKLPSEVIKVDYSSLRLKRHKDNFKTHSTIKPHTVKRILVNNQNIIEHTPPLSSSQSSGTVTNEDLFHSVKSWPRTRSKGTFGMSTSPLSVVDSFLPMPGEKDFKKRPVKTFIEDGGMSVLPMATGYFPKPAKGQTLLSFLTSGEFARTNAELDRENAHFCISEAIISAMEQIRCKRMFHESEDQMEDSDPEIANLKQRIRLRRTERVMEKRRKEWTDNLLSDGKTDTATSVSPRSTTPDTLSDGSSSDCFEDIDISQASNLKDSIGLSMSMASLYSEADFVKKQRGVPDGASDIMSAEGVALSLISKFSDKQLPKASDLEWLVTEQEAPQALLPLPKSWPVSPDSVEESHPTPLRGTQDWAPPRPQIIFTCHLTPSRKVIMAKQNYRCAGCSMRVAPKYASKFRYCEYLGRFFCTGCHTNQLALIPGRVLQKWDFSRYPVSTFSYRLLEQMYTDPLFRVFELNKNIEKLSKNLQFCRKYRMGLFYLKDFIFSCRYAELIQEHLANENVNFLQEPEVYSMSDLVSVRNGEMKNKLRNLVEMCCRHTSECKLCLAKGFICEVCNSDEVIFPWHMTKVVRCTKCGNCYHISCWSPKENSCKKCMRLHKRRESISTNPAISK